MRGSMDTAQAIATLGFRRWYERRLYQAHAWLLACLVGGFGMFAVLEGLDLRAPGLAPVFRILLALAAGLASAFAGVCYAALMVEAQRFAGASTCAQCHAYGRFLVERTAPSIQVRCMRCGHAWRIGAAPGETQ